MKLFVVRVPSLAFYFVIKSQVRRLGHQELLPVELENCAASLSEGDQVLILDESTLSYVVGFEVAYAENGRFWASVRSTWPPGTFRMSALLAPSPSTPSNAAPPAGNELEAPGAPLKIPQGPRCPVPECPALLLLEESTGWTSPTMARLAAAFN